MVRLMSAKANNRNDQQQQQVASSATATKAAKIDKFATAGASKEKDLSNPSKQSASKSRPSVMQALFSGPCHH